MIGTNYLPPSSNNPTIFGRFAALVLDLSKRLSPDHCNSPLSFTNLRKESEALSRIPEDPGFTLELIRNVSPNLRIAHEFSLLPVEGDKSKSSYAFSPSFGTDFKRIPGTTIWVNSHFQFRANLAGVFMGFYPSFVLSKSATQSPTGKHNGLNFQIQSRAPTASGTPIQQVVANLSQGGANLEVVYGVRENYFMLGYAQQLYKKLYLGFVSVFHSAEDESLATQWQGALRYESHRKDKGGKNIFTLLIAPYAPNLATSFSRKVDDHMTVTTDLQIAPSRDQPEMVITSQTGIIYNGANQGHCQALFSSAGTFQFAIEEPLGPIALGFNLGYNFKTNDAKVGCKLAIALEEPQPVPQF